MGIWHRIDLGLKWYERLGAIIVTTLVIAAPIAGAVYWLGTNRISPWVPVAVGVPLLVVVAILLGALRTPASASVTGASSRERQLERELAKIEAELESRIETAVDDYKNAVARGEYEKRLLTEALESIQQAVGTDEEWDVDDLVERGVLGSARGLLVRTAQEDVRLAVLIPADDPPEHWEMRWAAGHRPESVRKYAHPIDQTLAGIAFRRGEYVDRGDVQADDDFAPNPRETRPFASLVAVPLRIDEEIVGALSVVSTVTNAFTESDIAFIKAVGAVLDVVLAVEHDAGRWEEEARALRERLGEEEGGDDA